MARALVIGGGPAGLMAAEELARAGLQVSVAEQMPTMGRKLLMAGKSGLNMTKAEPREAFDPARHHHPGGVFVAGGQRMAQPAQNRGDLDFRQRLFARAENLRGIFF